MSELSVWDRAARIAGDQGSIVTVDHILAALAGEDAESEPSQTWDQSAALVRARSTDDDPVTIGRWVSVLGQPVGKKIVPPVAPAPVAPVTPEPEPSVTQTDTAVVQTPQHDVNEVVTDIQQAVNEAANGLPPARMPVTPVQPDETPDEPRIVSPERQLQVEDAAAQMRAISAEIRAELEHVNEDYLRLTREHEALTREYQRALQQNEDRKRLTGFTPDDASFLVEAIRRHKRTIYDNGGEEEKADAELYLSLEDITGQTEGPD